MLVFFFNLGTKNDDISFGAMHLKWHLQNAGNTVQSFSDVTCATWPLSIQCKWNLFQETNMSITIKSKVVLLMWKAASCEQTLCLGIGSISLNIIWKFVETFASMRLFYRHLKFNSQMRYPRFTRSQWHIDIYIYIYIAGGCHKDNLRWRHWRQSCHLANVYFSLISYGSFLTDLINDASLV